MLITRKNAVMNYMDVEVNTWLFNYNLSGARHREFNQNIKNFYVSGEKNNPKTLRETLSRVVN